MIIYREVTDRDLERIDAWTREMHIDLQLREHQLMHSVMAFDDAVLVGIATGRLVANTQYELLAVHTPRVPSQLPIADGLIRAFMHMADLRAMTKVIAKAGAVDSSLLTSLGFNQADDQFVSYVADFFQQGCQGCGRCSHTQATREKDER